MFAAQTMIEEGAVKRICVATCQAILALHINIQTYLFITVQTKQLSSICTNFVTSVRATELRAQTTNNVIDRSCNVVISGIAEN